VIDPRPGLRDVGMYDPPQLDVKARLNTNECPYPLPASFREDLASAVRDLSLNRYPDREAGKLRAALARHTGQPAEGIWVANGSNEILLQLLQAYGGPGRRVLIFEPTYAMYPRIAWAANSELVRLPLEPPWVIRAREVFDTSKADPAMILVCSPNNPTANTQPEEVIAELASRAPALVIVDEAYIEFGGTSAAPLVRRFPNVVVVRTFSKAFALAGARIGYCLAHPQVIEDLRRVRLPYHLGALTQAAGLVALAHREDAVRILDAVREQRDRLLAELPPMGVETYPSFANFVLFRPPRPPKLLWEDLLERDVLVRDVSEAVAGCLRVTAGTPEEVDRFLTSLEEVLA